jgi:DNA-binding LacI/PurR family transcriptional regulator
MATQKELAALAGVSAGTVSNVISGSTHVSEASRKKVLAAIQSLNYRPNLIARSLKTNRTHTLGIIVPDITIPFFPKIVRGAESAARERGYFLIVLDSQGSHEVEMDMLALMRQRADGILLVTAGDFRWSRQSVAQIESGPPVVCVDRLPEGLDTDSVCVDDFGAAMLGVKHLLASGHREIAMVTGPLSLTNEQERLRGYKHALREAGVPIKESLIWSAGFEKSDIQALCKRQLKDARRRPGALLASNGVTGIYALRSLYELGLSTPRDIAFVSIDELMTDELFEPRITSVLQPTYEIGYQAVEVLLNRIARGDTPSETSKVRLAASLVVRDSSRLQVEAAPGKPTLARAVPADSIKLKRIAAKSK